MEPGGGARSSRRTLAIAVLLLISLVASGHLGAPSSLAHDLGSLALVARSPILIIGNDNFTPANGVVSGAGSPTDPFVISGWTISVVGQNGIEVRNTTASFVIRNVSVSRSVAGGYPLGIYLWNVTNAGVETTNVSGILGGVAIRDSVNVSVSRLNLSASASSSIQLQHVLNISITESEFGAATGDAVNLTVESNHLLPFTWLNFQGSEIRIEGNWLPTGMIRLNNTSDATIVRNLAASIFLGYGPNRNVTIDSNNLVGGSYEVWLYGASNVSVTGNNLTGALDDGMAFGFVSDVVANGNRVSDSARGIEVGRSQDVLVYGNDFVNNTRGPASSGNTRLRWNASYPVGGNYWSEYAGVDLCGGPAQNVCPDPDGIGDSPYIIDSNDRDAYPMVRFIGADTTPPSVAILSPANGTVFVTSPVGTTGTAFDLGGSGLDVVQVRVNGGPWTSATGTAQWMAPAGLSTGENTIDAEAIDRAGNPSAVASVRVTYNPPPPPPNTPPYANFSWTPLTGNTSTTFTFTSTSYDSQDSATSLHVRWDWEDDGTWDTAWSTTPTAQHQFAAASAYNVTLEVMDTGGLTSNRTTEITVTAVPPPPPPPLRVTIAASPQEGTMPLTVSFTSSVSGGTPPYQYQWTLGDGSTSPSANTVHIYVTGGNFTVWMTVQDHGGAFEVSNALFVNVTAALVNLTVTPPTEFTQTSDGIAVTFTAAVTGGVAPYTFRWTFGDGTQSTDSSPSHTYATEGSYTVVVTVTDAHGSNATKSLTVTVVSRSPPPEGSPPWVPVLVGGGAAGAAVVIGLLWLRRRRHHPPT